MQQVLITWLTVCHWTFLWVWNPNYRNKSNDYFESPQYRQDVRHIAHYHKRKHFPSYKCCTENHNNTCAENRENSRFEIWYSVDRSGAIWRHKEKFQHGCTTIKSPQTFLKIARLNLLAGMNLAGFSVRKRYERLEAMKLFLFIG